MDISKLTLQVKTKGNAIYLTFKESAEEVEAIKREQEFKIQEGKQKLLAFLMESKAQAKKASAKPKRKPMPALRWKHYKSEKDNTLDGKVNLEGIIPEYKCHVCGKTFCLPYGNNIQDYVYKMRDPSKTGNRYLICCSWHCKHQLNEQMARENKLSRKRCYVKVVR